MKRLAQQTTILALFAMLLLAGCNPLAPFVFLPYLTGMDAKQKVKFNIPQDARRVAVVTYVPFGIQLEAGQVDRDINELLARRLFEGLEKDKRKNKTQVVKASKVQKWQDEHPDWHSMSKHEIAKALNADYVIYVEITQIKYFEEGSSKSLYRGHAELSVSVVRLGTTEDETSVEYPPTPEVVDFPGTNRPVPASDVPFQRFQRKFIERIAEKLSWHFVPHETGDEFAKDF